MPLIDAGNGSKVCIQCKHCAVPADCRRFVDIVSGDLGSCYVARAPGGPCGPEAKGYEPRATGPVGPLTTIETSMATISTDPWTKITKTYE